VLNKIDENLSAVMLNKLGKTRVIAQIPFNKDIQQKGLLGEELNINTPEIELITDFIIQKAKEEN
jgi:CO dehydrogenase nickel-insertion accessory protein CooC1